MQMRRSDARNLFVKPARAIAPITRDKWNNNQIEPALSRQLKRWSKAILLTHCIGRLLQILFSIVVLFAVTKFQSYK